MKKILFQIQQLSTGRTVLLFFIPAMILYLVMLFYTIPKVEQYAQGMQLFDLLPAGYSFDYSVTLLRTLGSEGRNVYLSTQLPLDFIYPGLFAISCSLMVSWLLLKSHHKNSKVFLLCFIPILAGLFDYIENIGIIYMLTSYPNISELSVSLASAMTIVKSALTTSFFIVLIFIGALMIRQKIKNE